MTIIHKETGKTLKNRKEAKLYYGAAYYNKLLRDKKLIFTNYIAFNEELHNNNQRN